MIPRRGNPDRRGLPWGRCEFVVPPDDYTFRYAAGIGDAWSVELSRQWHRRTVLTKGTAYNYGAPGFDAPNHPVPSIGYIADTDLHLACLIETWPWPDWPNW